MLALAEAHGSDSLEGCGNHSMAEGYYYKGDYNQAKIHQRKSIQIFLATGDTLHLARAYNAMGVLYDVTDNVDSALTMYSEALELHKFQKDSYGKSTVLGNIAYVYQKRKNYEMSLTYYQKVLAIDRKSKRTKETSVTLSNIGFLHYQLDNLDSALYYHMQAYDLRKESQNDLFLARGFAHRVLARTRSGAAGTKVQLIAIAPDVLGSGGGCISHQISS